MVIAQIVLHLAMLVFKMMDIMRELDDKSLSDLIKYGEYIANKRGE